MSLSVRCSRACTVTPTWSNRSQSWPWSSRIWSVRSCPSIEMSISTDARAVASAILAAFARPTARSTTLPTWDRSRETEALTSEEARSSASRTNSRSPASASARSRVLSPM
jgi:hypothetical protein